MPNFLTRSLTGALAVACLPLAAAEPTQLDAVVVTATRTAQTVDESLAPVTVITRTDIENTQARSVTDLLSLTAGVDVSRNGGLGKNAAVLLRGTSADHVLVLIDGVRAASATLGEYPWENLNPEQIERIEIVRGPRASLYGSDAVGGVIQIFTRRVAGPTLRLGVGSHGTRELSAGIGGGDDWRYSVNAGRLYTRGVPTNPIFNEDHGFGITHLTAGLSGPLGERGQLDFSLSRSEGQSEQDPDTGSSDFTNQVASLRLEHRTSDLWTQHLTLGHTLDEYTSHSLWSPATITTRRPSISWQNDLLLGEESLLTAGVDHWRDHATKDRSGTIDATLRNTGVFLQLQTVAIGSDWNLGLRRDEHSEFGSETTWNLGWGRDLGSEWRVTASLGTAFKAPTINDLYWPYSADTYFGTTYITEGNPDLDPERSRSVELGLRYRPTEVLTLDAQLFRTRIEDLIDWASSQTGPDEFTYRPVNVNDATLEGLELTASLLLGPWTLDGSFAYLRAVDEATGEQLDRRPRRKLTLKANHPVGAGTLQAEFLAVAGRNDASGAFHLPGYGLVNLAYRRPLQRWLDLELRVENLFDQEYLLAAGYSGPYTTLGRTLYLSLVYAPE